LSKPWVLLAAQRYPERGNPASLCAVTFGNVGLNFIAMPAILARSVALRLARSRRMRCEGAEQRIAAAKFIAAEVSPQEKA
jgi:hypothetical protein